MESSFKESAEDRQRKEYATRVGDKIIETTSGYENHRKIVHEETMKQRTPEQAQTVEQEREAFMASLDAFVKEAQMWFEETGDPKGAINSALLEAYQYRYRLNLED